MCSAALAELAGMPGLLAKVPAEEAILETSRPAPVPDTLWPRVLRSARRRRLRARAAVAGGGVLAAAAVVALIFAVPTLVAPAPAPTSVASTPGRSVALKQVIPSSLQASIRVVSEGWGTRIDMDCTYGLAAPGDGGAQPHSFDYGMYVTDARGHSVEIATWTAGPGTAAQLSGTTKLALDQITSVDVRSSDGTVLLNTSL
jgi:hypothetical protein